MKTTNMVHKVYFENKALKLVVSIRLNDECKNGHADFAITAMGYEKNRFGRWVDSFGGCCHEEILKRFPELKPFVDLHLCDSNGFPLYTVENGFYHLWDESKTPNQRKKIVKEYLRINDAEFNKLVKVKDKAYFHYMLEALDLPKRWKKEAKEAIKMLEKLTRQKWDNSYKWERGNYKPQSQAEKEEVKERLASGYYSPKRIKNREEQQRQERIKKQILEIKKDLRAEKKKHTQPKQI